MKALFAGSFDPFTCGHLDIVSRALNLLDEVIIGVASDTEKPRTPVDFREGIVKTAINNSPLAGRVRVCAYSGNTTDFAKSMGVNCLIRGIRNSQDFLYEKKLFSFYNAGGLEVVYFFGKNLISSKKVRDKLLAGKSLKGYIPACIIKEVTEYYKNNNTISQGL